VRRNSLSQRDTRIRPDDPAQSRRTAAPALRSLTRRAHPSYDGNNPKSGSNLNIQTRLVVSGPPADRSSPNTLSFEKAITHNTANNAASGLSPSAQASWRDFFTEIKRLADRARHEAGPDGPTTKDGLVRRVAEPRGSTIDRKRSVAGTVHRRRATPAVQVVGSTNRIISMKERIP
jgi:hypothetical protein